MKADQGACGPTAQWLVPSGPGCFARRPWAFVRSPGRTRNARVGTGACDVSRQCKCFMADHSGLDRACIHRQKVLTLGPGRWERRRGRRRGCMRRRAGGRQTLDFDPKGALGDGWACRAWRSAGIGVETRRAARDGFILGCLTKQPAGRGPKGRRSPSTHLQRSICTHAALPCVR